ncbi:DUF3450 domain-containing protein [Methylobacter marinus]|uniref:DUF3450 domain-containing protein n=1 Tax=Methylobacter marinus TaxID=34058 RepID=UPI0003A3509E|nr:DUF3450 domain-containing protein [Methylobacter marinus]
MKTKRRFRLKPGLLGLCLLFAASAAAQQAVDKALQEQLSAQKQGTQTQKRVDKLDDQTQAMLEEYRSGTLRLEDLSAYNTQMERLIDDQKAEMSKKEIQMRDIVEMERQIAPFLQRMIDVLAEFVALDTPFLPDERQQRLQQLTQMMHRSDVSVTEKYRRIMEAYRVEAEYGHTLEAYQGTLNGDGEPRSVEFLRLGRVGLYYLTLKGDEGGYWLRSSKQWVPLDASLRESLEKAIRVAKKQTPPDLLILPIMAPEAKP